MNPDFSAARPGRPRSGATAATRLNDEGADSLHAP